MSVSTSFMLYVHRMRTGLMCLIFLRLSFTPRWVHGRLVPRAACAMHVRIEVYAHLQHYLSRSFIDNMRLATTICRIFLEVTYIFLSQKPCFLYENNGKHVRLKCNFTIKPAYSYTRIYTGTCIRDLRQYKMLIISFFLPCPGSKYGKLQ